jgi:aminodeoxyfutalosine deaminase
MLATDSFIHGLPKAELHVHMQGAASAETILALSQRYPDEGLPQDLPAMEAFYRFTDFAAFIRTYVAVSRLVRTADDVYDLAVGLSRDLARCNVRYAEATVTADSHLKVGIESDALSDALTRGRRDAREQHGVELAWVFDIDGEFGTPSGQRTLDWIRDFRPDGTIGYGLGGPEAGIARSDYGALFARARDLGLRSLPHAGETVGPHEIWSAIDDLHAERIGHGITAASDPALMDTLAERRIALEVCPTSNVCTGAVASLEEHPFPILREAGVALTINTDDPGMFSTDLDAEYRIARDVFDLDADALVSLAQQSVQSSYAPIETREKVLREIDDYAAETVYT